MGGINNRTLIIGGLFIFMTIVFLSKLFLLQVIDTSYRFSAESNAKRPIIQYPSRGLVYDRNGHLIVSNQAVYDIMIIPRELADIDSTDFAFALGIDRSTLDYLFDAMHKNLKSKHITSYKPSIFLKQLSAEQYAVFQEKQYKYKGFFAQRRTLRKYEYPNAAHILGYVSEVGKNDIKEDNYYIQGDYHGISGIEKSYEKELRGRKGTKYILVDVHGREKGLYRDGRFDSAAVSGKNITLTIDMDLQVYGEKLMQNKIGSILAIEPSTGEILSLVSSPTYDPSMLVGRDRAINFPKLFSDTLKPMFNRAIQAGYPPGSTFKTLNALIGLQEGVLKPNNTYSCSMGYHSQGLTVGCHSHRSPLNLPESIQHSCNAYYCNVFRNILDNPRYSTVFDGMNKWRDYLVKFGFGYRLGIDFDNEIRGLVPNGKYYDKIYGPNRWHSLMVVSLSIGQGELLTTPIQMANMAATISNKGHFYTPHIIKEIEDSNIPEAFKLIHETGIDTANFTPVIKGMELAVWGGAGSTAGIARIPNITICGKTGTAQNPHGEDHSIFIAFAPRENPKIAIAVYVENGGYGATYAAPIASLMVEKYLTGEIDRSRNWTENRILEANLIDNNAKGN